MGRMSPQKRRTLTASKARRGATTSSGPRRIDEILPAANPIDAPPSIPEGRESVQPAHFDPSPVPGRLKRKRTSSLTVEYGRKKPRSALASLRLAGEAVDQLEQKWLAVVKFASAQSQRGSVTNATCDDIARELELKASGSTIRSWYNRAISGKSLVRDDGSGRASLNHHAFL